MKQQCAIPGSWARTTIGATAEIVRGVSFPKDARKLVPHPGHVACLRTANVQREVEWDDLWFVPEEYVKVESRYVQPLDVLISVSNSLELVGKVAQVTNLPQKSTLGAFISLLRPSSGLDAKFYYYQMASPEVQSEIRYSASTTTNISNISSGKLSAVTLEVPSLAEQHRIVVEIETQFTRLDASVSALRRAQANLKRYRASVLKAACEGRLVPTEAELGPLRRPRLRARCRYPAEAHPGRAPRPLGVAGEAAGQVQGTLRPGRLRPAGTTGRVGVERYRPTSCFEGGMLEPLLARAKEDYWNGEVQWVSSGEVSTSIESPQHGNQ